MVGKKPANIESSTTVMREICTQIQLDAPQDCSRAHTVQPRQLRSAEPTTTNDLLEYFPHSTGIPGQDSSCVFK